MLWHRYRQVPGRQDTMLVADSKGVHVSKEPRHGKDGPQRQPVRRMLEDVSRLRCRLVA